MKKKQIKPLGDRILVREVKTTEVSAGGIFLPEISRTASNECVVISTGPGKRNKNGKLIPLDVNAGDHVFVKNWVGTEVQIDGEPYKVVIPDDVVGVCEKQ
jgi:chaperonin GroES